MTLTTLRTAPALQRFFFFFSSFYSSSCRYAENFKSFPLLSFISLIHFWKLFIPNLHVSLDSISPLPPSEDAGRVTPIFTKIPQVYQAGSCIPLSSQPWVCQGLCTGRAVLDPCTLSSLCFTHKQELPPQPQHQHKTLSPPPRPAAHTSCILS